MTRRLLALACSLIVVASTIPFIAPFVDAQESAEQTLRQAREEQAEIRRAKADLAKEVDLLEASTTELIEALEVLNTEIVAQEQRVELARGDVTLALEREAQLRSEIEATGVRAEALRELAQDRVVAAYVAPRDRQPTSDDLTATARRDALFRQVDLDGRDLVDQLRAVADDLAHLEQLAAEAAAEAADRELQLQTELAVLNSDVEAQERLREALADEIAHLENEIDEMAATEAQLAGIIRDQQREIARQEALRRAALTTTTTTTTTSTTAPPSTAATSDTTDPDTTDPDTTNSAGDADADTTAADDAASDDSPDGGTTTTTEALGPVEVSIIWPTTGAVTSKFGNRVHPITGRGRFHAGVDIGSRSGSPIWAAQSGTVIFSGWMSGYGQTVMVDHGRYVTLYAHQSERQISEGASVNQGQQIGLVGSTGFSTGPHLHFEVRIDGNAVNPMTYLP